MQTQYLRQPGKVQELMASGALTKKFGKVVSGNFGYAGGAGPGTEFPGRLCLTSEATQSIVGAQKI